MCYENYNMWGLSTHSRSQVRKFVFSVIQAKQTQWHLDFTASPQHAAALPSRYLHCRVINCL